MAAKNKKKIQSPRGLRGKSFVQEARETGKGLDHVIVTALMKDAQSQGACEDWPDIKGICLNTARMMTQSSSPEACYELLRNAIHLYDQEIICNLYRSVPRTKRLAFFISQVAVSLRDDGKFLEWFVSHELGGFANLEPGTMLGLIIRRIATQDALNVCARYFRADLLRAARFEQLRMKQLREDGRGAMGQAIPAAA